MKNLAVLISNAGSGTNLQAIINGASSGKINGKVKVVISCDNEAYGLVRAKKHKIHIKLVSKEDDITEVLKKYNIDFVCLSGWRLIIPDQMIDDFKILNTHPGLIPDNINGVCKNPDNTEGLWNKGKLTVKAIQNFLDQKATYAGCTNHFLSHEFDFGIVLGRCFEKIRKGDTVDSLYKRLKVKENKLYVKVLAKLCN